MGSQPNHALTTTMNIAYNARKFRDMANRSTKRNRVNDNSNIFFSKPTFFSMKKKILTRFGEVLTCRPEVSEKPG